MVGEYEVLWFFFFFFLWVCDLVLGLFLFVILVAEVRDDNGTGWVQMMGLHPRPAWFCLTPPLGVPQTPHPIP